MEKTEKVKVEMPMVSLKFVVLAVPKGEIEKLQLIEDLFQIKCEELFARPWCLKNEDMAREFLQEHSNEWEGTIRRDLEWWTTDAWAEVYNFAKEGRR